MMKQLSIYEYYDLDKKIDRHNRKVGAFCGNADLVRVAILGSFTIHGIKEALNVKCDEAGLLFKSYIAPYNQYNQELLDRGSSLYKFKPHLTILCLDIKDVLGDHYYFPYRMTARKRKQIVEERVHEISGLLEVFSARCKGKLILNNFSVPSYSPVGILENKQAFGFFEMVRSLNRSLEKICKDNSQMYIFDYDNFLNRYGKVESCDDNMLYLADMKLNQNLIPSLCDEYMRYIKAMMGKSRKCIVLDLDDTLWGGIVGEDGYEGIALGSTPPGNAFVDFQKYILSLHERGVLLAINSSNNIEDAMRVIEEHPGTILRENNFASIKINWANKANNMIEIAKELNIGLDSLVYVDDDKRNRQLVMDMLPQVLVLDLPEDPALYLHALRECTDLDVLQITEEDKRRGLMYAQERARQKTRMIFDDIADYLAHLEIKVKIHKANSFLIPRISQLTQKTNQFNSTTRRYLEEDVRSIVKDKGYHVYAVGVEDKFGDSGISGAVILKKDNDSLIFDNFLLSCRVLGKGIEEAVIAFCVDRAKRLGAKHLIYEYIQTEKNAVVRKFLESSPFKFFKRIDRSELWRFDLKEHFKKPKFIKMITR